MCLKPTKCHECKQFGKMSFLKNVFCKRIFYKNDTAFGQQMSCSNLWISLFWNPTLVEGWQKWGEIQMNQVASRSSSCSLAAKTLPWRPFGFSPRLPPLFSVLFCFFFVFFSFLSFPPFLLRCPFGFSPKEANGRAQPWSTQKCKLKNCWHQ